MDEKSVLVVADDSPQARERTARGAREEFRPTRLAAVFGKALAGVRERAGSKRVAICAELRPAGLALSVKADGVARALEQLLCHAVAAAPERGTLRLSAHRRDQCVEIEVEHGGSCVVDGRQTLDAFFTAAPGAAGLGLCMIGRMLTEHGGTVRLSSEPGRTCVTLVFPGARDVAVCG